MSNEPAFHIVLHQPQIPQNTGSIGRTCLATGSKLWLVRPLGFRVDQSNLRRAGLDYWDQLDWEAVDSWDRLDTHMAERRVWFLTKHAKRLYTNAEFEAGDTFVFGSETQGLPDSILQANAERALRIPVRPKVRSLNLACAVAVVVYEAVRAVGAKCEPSD